MDVYPYCLCTSVPAKAIASFLDGRGLEGGGVGSYRDAHPWLIAREMKEAADGAAQALVVLIASGEPPGLTHWTVVTRIDVVELHRGMWETACDFSSLEPVPEIWSPLDSVILKPGDDQLRRERLEPIRKHRQLLDVRHIHPYAVCETPAFLMLAAKR